MGNRGSPGATDVAGVVRSVSEDLSMCALTVARSFQTEQVSCVSHVDLIMAERSERLGLCHGLMALSSDAWCAPRAIAGRGPRRRRPDESYGVGRCPFCERKFSVRVLAPKGPSDRGTQGGTPARTLLMTFDGGHLVAHESDGFSARGPNRR